MKDTVYLLTILLFCFGVGILCEDIFEPDKNHTKPSPTQSQTFEYIDRINIYNDDEDWSYAIKTRPWNKEKDWRFGRRAY